MSNPEKIKFTVELLRDYSLAALANASELILEATILHKHGYSARAYFLAVASIEETGKAFLAFDGQGRNLLDSAISSKLKRNMEDHSMKIRSAFIAWLFTTPDISETVMPMIDYMIDLKYGREPSMYTDIHADTLTVHMPATAVREKAAFDCIRLAKECLSHTQKYLSEKIPNTSSKAQDQIFAMKSNHFQKIMEIEDFWWYYISEMEAGRIDWAEGVISYRDKYLNQGNLFRNVTENDI